MREWAQRNPAYVFVIGVNVGLAIAHRMTRRLRRELQNEELQVVTFREELARVRSTWQPPADHDG